MQTNATENCLMAIRMRQWQKRQWIRRRHSEKGKKENKRPKFISIRSPWKNTEMIRHLSEAEKYSIEDE